MKITNSTKLPTPVVRKVFHWWFRQLKIPGLPKLYPDGVVVGYARRSENYRYVISGRRFVVKIGARFRDQSVETQLHTMLKACFQAEGFWIDKPKASSIAQIWDARSPALIEAWLAEEAGDRPTPAKIREAKIKSVEVKLKKATKSQATWARKAKLAKTKLAKYTAQVKRYRKVLDERVKTHQEAVWCPFKELER